MCFTQVKPSSYVGTICTKQVLFRNRTQCFGARSPDLSEYSKGNLPLLTTGAVAFPLCEISFIRCSAQAWRRADVLPQAYSALRCHSCTSTQEEDGKPCLLVIEGLLGRAFPSNLRGIFSASRAFSVPLAVPAGYGKSSPAADFKTLFQDKTCREE